ncbi:MAG: benzoate-CoA ligase family protein [Candidatus Eremiobacterota bacterium]
MTPPEQFNLAEHLLDARVTEGYGERVALCTPSGPLTYRQVQQRANRMANLLVQRGVEPEHRVILALPDGPEFVAALFAILKLGATVVMLNPALPAEEVEVMLAYTRARAAVVSRDGMAAYARLKVLIAGDEDLTSQPDGFANYPTHRDDVAVWLFSGGTTGRPKAVLQSHRSFCNTTELYARRFLGYAPDDRTLSVPKLYFGYATGSNLFFPFSVGASAVLFPEKSTAEAIFEQIALHRPTILVNVPTLINHMVNHPSAGSQDLSCLRLCTSAGEALPESLHAKWMETFGVELLDGLGTAEMWHIFLSNPPGAARPGTLGVAVPGFDVRVRDDEGRDLPDGEVGRLWVAGDSRAVCYWQEAEKSQEAFRGRWFASSDLVCRDPDGYFRYCGRGDELLKVAGRWLAPAEVEGCLLTHPAVRECAVVGVVCEDGLTRPHAYVVADNPGRELEDALKTHALERLEPYKHPRRVFFVEALPRTHLGKVDRGALRRN